jgi:hypothetical protein
MSIQQRLQQLLEERGEGYLPWPYGVDENALPPDIAPVWQMLNPVEKLAISRHCPLKAGRNTAILKLFNQGYSQKHLQKLSGFSIQQIKLITARRKVRYEQ